MTSPTPDQQVIVVAGMHRSGTSALAGVLHHAGAALPKTLMAASPANPNGFFESQPIVDAHEACFRALGLHWNDVGPFPPNSTPGEDAGQRRPWEGRWIERFARVFRDEFPAASPGVFKDPRICRLIPVWEAAWSSLEWQVEPLYVITVRHPLEVAASLERAYDMPLERSLLLWLDHFLRAEKATRSRPRCFLSYDELLLDWRSALSRLDRSLSTEFHGRADGEAVDEFLSPALRRHRRSAEELEARRDVSPALKRAYAWGLRACRDEDVEMGELDVLREALVESQRAFAPLLRAEEHTANEWMEQCREYQEHIDSLRERLQVLQQDHREVASRANDRQQELRRAAEWVRHVLAWGARLRAGEPPSGELMKPLFEVLAAADPGQVPEFAGAGLRWLDGVYEIKRLQKELEESERELAKGLEERAAQDIKISKLEQQLASREVAAGVAVGGAPDSPAESGASSDALRESAYAVEVLKRRLQRIESSAGWRATAPLRALARALRALFGR